MSLVQKVSVGPTPGTVKLSAIAYASESDGRRRSDSAQYRSAAYQSLAPPSDPAQIWPNLAVSGDGHASRNAVESLPSSRSALSFVTFAAVFTARAGRPAAALKLAAAPVLVFVTLRAGPVVPAESPVVELAEFDWPRMKLPPVTA